jgi:hypothetical protein
MTGIREHPPPSTAPAAPAMAAAWLSASLIAATLPSWLRLLAMDGQLARAEPKALRTGSCTHPPA